jgi:ATP-dependent RNA helicase DHX8/PRP22
VCPTRGQWVEPLLPKLQDVDVQRLSGGKLTAQHTAGAGNASAAATDGDEGQAGSSKADAAQKLARRNDDGAVDAARQRYLQRKQAAAGTKRK